MKKEGGGNFKDRWLFYILWKEKEFRREKFYTHKNIESKTKHYNCNRSLIRISVLGVDLKIVKIKVRREISRK